MKILFISTILILIFAFAANAQTVEPDALEIANQRLVKTLDALDKTEAEKKSLERENAALVRLNETSNALVVAKEAMLQSKNEEVETLRKIKCSEFSLLKIGAFKLFHKKTCY